MQVRPYYPDQYPILDAWWKAHGWPSIDPTLLPETGSVVWQGLQPVAAAFIYMTNSNFAVIEWVLSSKESVKIERDEALDLLLDSLMATAKKYGKTTVFTSTKHPKLIERFKSKGFTVGDEGMTNLIGRIK